MNPPAIPPEEYRRRRERVFDQIGPEAVALLQGGPQPRTHDRFRQVNDVRYLCPIEAPHAYVLLDARDHTTRLFLPVRPHDPLSREEPRPNAGDPQAAAARTAPTASPKTTG